LNKILIIGAGGFGRELLQWIKDINAQTPKWEIEGFLDDDLHALDTVECDYPIVGKLTDWQPKEDQEFALAIGTPIVKEKIAKKMLAQGAKFPPIIHPTATLTKFSKYGQGLVMFPYSKLSVNSTVGDFVTILSSGIGHDVTVGDYTTISGACNILRNVRIGNRVFLAAGVSVAQDIQIDNDANIGLGSVVVSNVKANAHMFGNPARIMPVNG
jgi:sugar O-acyltransferase (sialic acid O-acetyltransferase NeuD family)